MEAIIDPALEAYAVKHTTTLGELPDELYRYTRQNCKDAQMLVGPLEGAMLRLLVQLCGASRVIEIGTFTGYSALSIAAALPPDGELICCDIDEQTSAIAQSFFARSSFGDRITLKLAPALDTIAQLDGQFDMVFIDADKENYLAYYQSVMPKLKSGGIVVADNVLWSGAVLNPKLETDHALVEFNQHVHTDPRVDNLLLPIRDGLMVIRKR